MKSRTGQMKELQADIDRLRDVLRMEVERADNGWRAVEEVRIAVAALATPERMNLPPDTNILEAINKAGEYIDRSVGNGLFPEGHVIERSEAIQND